METLINNYGRLIDKIRKDRNESRQDLCEGIMSVRNFQRFANGEVSISNDKIIKLIDRLRLDYFTFNQIYKSMLEDEYSKLVTAFNLSINWKADEASIELAKVDKDSISSSYNKQMYEIAEALINKKKGKLSTDLANHKIEKAIDFPNILNQKIINIVELNGLYSLNTKYSSKDDTRIIEFLISIVTDNKYNTFGLTKETVSSIYSTVSKGLFMIGEYDKCITFCDLGIDYCRSTYSLVGMSNLFGYKALALDKLGRLEESYENAALLAIELQLEGKPDKLILYRDIIKKSLNIEFEDLIEIKKRTN